MKIEIGQAVLVSDRYNGLVWEVVKSEVDEYGEFETVDADGEGHVRNVEEVGQVQ